MANFTYQQAKFTSSPPKWIKLSGNTQLISLNRRFIKS